MNAAEETNIVSFEAGRRLRLPKCVVCGTLTQTGTCCEDCAGGMLDVPLSGDFEDAFLELLPEPFDGPQGKEELPLPLGYEHYEICRSETGLPFELGRGAMGVTYKALDTDLHCVVALKVINPAILADAVAGERFLREARSLAQIRHQNIATIFRLGTAEGSYFYAMEYIKGETLEAHVRRKGAIPFEAALEIIAQAARALSVAHGKAFVHRDIKPSNIMLAEEGNASARTLTVKLIDFGLVKAMVDDDLVPLGYFAGSPYFASPEQWAGGKVDSRSDIYSLGVCLWYMLGGTPPRLALSSIDGWRQSQPVPSPMMGSLGNTPANVVTLLESMVATDPASRPQTADDVLERIHDCLGATVSPKRIKSGMLIVAGLVLGLLALGGGLRKVSTMNKEAHAKAKSFFDQGNEFFREHTAAGNRKAVEFYSKAIAQAPDFADAHAAFAIADLQNYGRYGLGSSHLDSALVRAQEAIAIDPKAPKGYHALGLIRSFQRKPWEALGQLHQALELNPKYLPAMRDFSLLWSSVGQPQTGLAWAKAAVDLDPSDLVAWNGVADASTDLCDDQMAEAACRRCLEISPMWMSGLCCSLHLHLLQGNFAQARKDFAITESVDPGTILPLTLKAQIELFSGEYDEAEKAYRRLLVMNRPGLVNYYGGISYLSALGYLRCRAGERTEGEALLAEAAELHKIDSEGPQVTYDLAAIRSVQGHTEEALSLLQQAIASGWLDHRTIRLDPRFESLRDEYRFREILATLSEHVAKMRLEAERLCAKPISIADYPIRPAKN